MVYKALIRVDGNNSLGLGDVFSCLNLALSLKDFDVLFVTRYKESFEKIKEFGFKVEKIPKNVNLEEEMDIIKKINQRFNPSIFITEQVRDDYEEYCKKLSELSKTLIVETFGNMQVYNDILVNWDVILENQRYIKKNPHTVYCFGPKYMTLRPNIEKYHNLDKRTEEKVRNVLITMGGGDARNLTPKVIEALKGFKEIKFSIIIGSAFNNRSEIDKVLRESNLHHELIENVNDISDLIYNSDIVICSGGLTPFEAAAIGTPFIGISSKEWEGKRLKRMEELNVCRYAGNWDSLRKDDLYKIFQNLLDKKERLRLSINSKKLVDGGGSERISEVIRKVVSKN